MSMSSPKPEPYLIDFAVKIDPMLFELTVELVTVDTSSFYE